MTKDLEDTLLELGPGYPELVARMKKACGDPFRVRRKFPFCRVAVSSLAAASVAVAVSVAFMSGEKRPRNVDPSNPYMLAFSSSAESVARAQRPDGSWGSDYLTRQNAAALRAADPASVQYKKAVRYLRSRGLSPMSAEEFSSCARL